MVDLKEATIRATLTFLQERRVSASFRKLSLIEEKRAFKKTSRIIRGLLFLIALFCFVMSIYVDTKESIIYSWWLSLFSIIFCLIVNSILYRIEFDFYEKNFEEKQKLSRLVDKINDVQIELLLKLEEK